MTIQERDELRQLSDIIIKLTAEVKNLGEKVDSALGGNTANCAAEKEQMKEVKIQIGKLWETRASALSLNLLWGITMTVYAGLIIFLVTR